MFSGEKPKSDMFKLHNLYNDMYHPHLTSWTVQAISSKEYKVIFDPNLVGGKRIRFPFFAAMCWKQFVLIMSLYLARTQLLVIFVPCLNTEQS